jgi:hypothetical protein
VVVGFPLFLALGLRHVESVHASVVIGILPLATAVVGIAVAAPAAQRRLLGLRAGRFRAGRRPSCCCAHDAADSAAQWADLLLLLAMLSAACGYVSGGRN